MMNSSTHAPAEKRDDCARPVANDEQNTPNEMEFIDSVLNSMADQNLDALSAEEIEELFLEMERAADGKIVPSIPLPDLP